MDGAMEYEDCLRYAFDQCGRRGGPQHLGDADLFRGARSRDEWSKVDLGLSKAIERVRQDAPRIAWRPDDEANGGVAPNFLHNLEGAERALASSDPAAVRAALAQMIHPTKALTLKASGTIPREYEGGR